MAAIRAKVKSLYSSDTGSIRALLMDADSNRIAAIDVPFGNNDAGTKRFEVRVAMITTAMLHRLKITFWFDENEIYDGGIGDYSVAAATAVEVFHPGT